MQIDRVIYPVESLGPGKRLVIWTVGCSKHCKRCINQELWAKDESKNIDVKELFCALVEIINSQDIDGITITGGDPFEQFPELLELLKLLKTICNDILVYTGYTINEIQELLTSTEMNSVAELISVLIDGRYIDSENDNYSPLRGSCNQKLIFFDEKLRNRYEEYLSKGRCVQNIFYNDRVISIGIHNKEVKR